ncbi:unnamed protein product [Kuraishia capsulata CBS 1993]|uniref:RRM domain-containing protein n=1 Tax=Kuraishia capsulata CBS 1993 TaxID=1382522 RepID=W6MMA6_9ASCO|nr:uncharacterized protein KUCA_T00003688001 [Kuraishia capsulata CBS 1993]CDK27709.1 unnamed protein product [Kuraishia capsulata CBS 1993]
MSKGIALNTSCVLYIGAIPYNWDVEVIKAVVCGSGPIVDVRCMMDSPGKNKGFCFVEYATPDDAQRALRLLSQVKIEGRKKLRIELSKEGLRNPSPVGTKPELLLSRNFLPPNVVIPNEMMNGLSHQPTSFDFNSNGNAYAHQPSQLSQPDLLQQISSSPQLQRMVQQMLSQGMDMNQVSNVIQQYLSKGSQFPQPPQQRIVMPNSLLDATNHLPKVEKLPFVTRERISETLSQIHPAVLIQLIATLKQTLEGPNQQYAATVLNSNPQLAVAAAQSLLLMGVIDTDVIDQAVSKANTQQQPQQPTLSTLQQSNAASAASAAAVVNSAIPLQPTNAHTNNQFHQETSNPMYNNSNYAASSSVDPDWIGLSQSTIEKLSKMEKSESSLIVQVLKLPPDQVENLPPQQKIMVEQLRNQYR